MKKKTFDFPVFKYSITVIIAKNIKEAYHKKYKLEYGDIEPFGLFAAEEGGARGTIFLKPDSKMGTIAHECFHAAFDLAKQIAATKEEELIAYHITYLVEQIMGMMKSK